MRAPNYMQQAIWSLWLIVAAVWIIVGLLIAFHATAQAQEGQYDEYMGGLRLNGLGCCGGYDCKVTEAGLAGDVWEVLIDRQHGFPLLVQRAESDHEVPTLLPDPGWIPVPPERVLHGQFNPTSRPVACWSPARGIICFVPPPEA